MRIELDSAEWIHGPGYRKNRLADEVALACPGTLVQRVEMGLSDFLQGLGDLKFFGRSLLWKLDSYH